MLTRRNFVATACAAAATPLRADPLGQRPGIQLYTVKDALARDTPGTLKQLAAIGYRTVETFSLGKYSPRDFRALLAANGLACASCHLDFRDGDNGALFDTAHALGARFVVSAGLFGAAGVNPANANAAAFHAMAALAGRIGAAARQAGLNFALHNHNMEFRRFGAATGHEMLLNETDPALVGFELDCGWAAVAGHDPTALLKAHPGRYSLLHIKDFARPPAPRTAPGGPPGAVLGKGFIDYRPVFAAAKGVRYCFVEQEPPFRGFTELDAARQDYAYLHALQGGCQLLARRPCCGMASLSRPTKPQRLDEWAPSLLKAQLYGRILVDIIIGALKPGEQLEENVLARRYDGGLAGIRDALARLALEGLVVRKARVGTTVAALDLGEARDAFEARRLVEIHCAGLAAAQGGDADIAAIRATLGGGEAAIEADDARALAAMDEAFHVAVAAASGNRTLTKMVVTLHHQTARYWLMSVTAPSRAESLAALQEHRALADVIAARDPGGAREMMARVLGELPDDVIRALGS